MKELEQSDSSLSMVNLNQLRKELQTGLKSFCATPGANHRIPGSFKNKAYRYTEESLFRINDDLLN
jgi:hypothetical protein